MHFIVHRLNGELHAAFEMPDHYAAAGPLRANCRELTRTELSEECRLAKYPEDFYIDVEVAEPRPPDGEELVTQDWLMTVIPAINRANRSGQKISKLGRLAWLRTHEDTKFSLLLNGEVLRHKQLTRRQIRNLASALDIVLKE